MEVVYPKRVLASSLPDLNGARERSFSVNGAFLLLKAMPNKANDGRTPRQKLCSNRIRSKHVKGQCVKRTSCRLRYIRNSASHTMCTSHENIDSVKKCVPSMSATPRDRLVSTLLFSSDVCTSTRKRYYFTFTSIITPSPSSAVPSSRSLRRSSSRRR